MVLPIGAGAACAGRMVAERVRQRVRSDRSVPDALEDIAKDRLWQAKTPKRTNLKRE